jgi:putative RNA 2'-phosphotransferase
MSVNLKSHSKFLSLLLRHQPEKIALSLDAQGWAVIDELINKANAHGHYFTPEILSQIVRENDKQRFIISADGLKIRANQGHSLEIDLQLIARQPPEILYHGTASRFLDAILTSGLTAQSRQYVHLSDDLATALKVGQRHGKAIILEVAAQRMFLDDYRFYLSANQVWLTAQVPCSYLNLR